MISESIILNIPHASTTIPNWIYDRIFLPQAPEEKEKGLFQPLDAKKRMIIDYELLMMTDWYTDELFDQGLFPTSTATVSRLVCDTERFEDDSLETMSGIGMGLCYTTGFDMNPIKRYLPEHRQYILEHYYRPHHRRLQDLVDESLEKEGRAMILDCHSFYPIPLPYETHTRLPRPDICIGTDSFHTPTWLSDLAMEHFRSLGYTVALNDPFSGSIVPLKHYGRDSRVLSLMIELNRGLYLRPGTHERNAHFSLLRKQLLAFEHTIDRCLTE